MTAYKIAVQEFKWMVSSAPKLMFIMFIMPLVYSNVYNILFSRQFVTDMPLVICDESQSRLSRELDQSFEDSEYFSVVAYASSREEAQEYLKEKKADIIIDIPADLTTKINTGLSSAVLLQINGTNSTVASAAVLNAQDITDTFSQNIGASLLAGEGTILAQAREKVSPVRLETRVLYNPSLSYTDYFLYCLLMMSFHMTVFFCSAGSMLIEYKLSKYKDFSTLQVLTGKLLPFWVLGIIAYAAAITAGLVMTGSGLHGNVFELLLLGGTAVFAFSSLAALLVSFFKAMFSFYQLVMSCVIPIFLLSGSTYPIAAMPSFIRPIVSLLPFTLLASTVRSLVLAGHAPDFFMKTILLFVYGAAAFLLALYRFKKIRLRRLQQ